MPVVLTTAEWEAYRETIHWVYIEQDQCRDEVMRFMKENHGFDATLVLTN